MAIPTTNSIDPRIRTEMVPANGLDFEVDMIGEGDRFAICLHGFPEHSVSWRRQLPHLASLGYRAWAPNLRGYGNSSVPMFVEDYSIENLMADVAALIDAAAPTREVTLIGHDWGALIAWYFAIRQIRPLDNLVICNVPHPFAASRGLGFEQLRRSWYVFFFQLPWLPELALRRGNAGQLIRDGSSQPGNYPPEVVNLYQRNAAREENARAMLNYYRALLRGGGAARQRRLGMPKIMTRTLMIWGEDDVALTRATTYGTSEFVDDFTIRYLPRISHWVQQDAPEVVNAMLTAFLEGSPVPEMRWEMTCR